VSDLRQTLAKAAAAGVEQLVRLHMGGLQSATVRFPGGYIAASRAG
jgi:hypothetical protein